MASALVAGVAIFAGVSGTVGVTAALTIGLAAAAATAVMEDSMSPDSPTQLGADTKAQGIDKTALQQEAELGALSLGESREADRKKGKARWKIALDEEKESGEAIDTGVQLPTKGDEGVQL